MDIINKSFIKRVWPKIKLWDIFYLSISKKFILYENGNNIKVCVCTVGKQENKYIREFVDYYKKYGIDKIFLYDNNDEDGESFEEVIKDYIDKGFVQINNWRGIKRPGIRTLKDCYMKNNQAYDWLIFYDIDEYIHLKNIPNIKIFLNDKKFIKCKKIYLNWVIHTDNNLLKYDNRSLHERFPKFKPLKRNKKYIGTGKTIIRGGIKNIRIREVHVLDKKIPRCNSQGKIIKSGKGGYIDFENYFIEHYYFKSLEEFILKIKKGDTYFGHNKGFIMHRLKRYFMINDITLKKIEFLENKLKLNLSNYKKIWRLYNLCMNVCNKILSKLNVNKNYE